MADVKQTSEANDHDGVAPPTKESSHKLVEDAASLGSDLDAQGRLRPRFILDFPEDDQLKNLSDAFERGDFHYVRKNADRVISSSKSETVRSAARELVLRTEPDPVVKLLFGFAVLLFTFLVWWSYQ